MTAPVRLRLSRAPGFNLQALSRATNGLICVSVARPSRWGNRWRVLLKGEAWYCEDLEAGLLFPCDDRAEAQSVVVQHHAAWLEREPLQCRDARELLRGANLACWCSLDEPCHAQNWLKVANA